jgi:hypothetical protein
MSEVTLMIANTTYLKHNYLQSVKEMELHIKISLVTWCTIETNMGMKMGVRMHKNIIKFFIEKEISSRLYLLISPHSIVK